MKSQKNSAFQLLEVCFAMALISLTVCAVLAALMSVWFNHAMSRDGLEAIQILVGRTETLRLCGWDELMALQSNSPVAFIETRPGMEYSGTMTIESSGIDASYSNSMRKVTFNLNWKTGDLPRTRTWQTFVSDCGLQSYIY